MYTVTTHHLGPRNVRALDLTAQDCANPALLPQLSKIGFGLDMRQVTRMIAGMSLDSAPGLAATAASVTTPVQFLQTWLPDLIRVVTAPRLIDELVGITTAGAWEAEEVVQGIVERTGTAQGYSDRGGVTLTGANFNAERRTVVRGEAGLEVGQLEEARATTIRLNLATEKRTAASEALEIFRNAIGFFGYNDGASRTFGFLNDPNLPPYVPVPGNGATTKWSGKTFLEIVTDLRGIFEGLRMQSKGLIRPETDKLTLALPVGALHALSMASEFGNSVMDWLKKTYPGTRVLAVPELDGANGGANAGYLFAETFGASGGGATFVQVVPARFRTLGVERRVKSYLEAMTNATAGLFLRYPIAVTRFTGF